MSTHEDEDDLTTVIGVRITTGGEAESVVTHLNTDVDIMDILIHGYEDDEGVQHVDITASGPPATQEGMEEMGRILETLGKTLRTKQGENDGK